MIGKMLEKDLLLVAIEERRVLNTSSALFQGIGAKCKVYAIVMSNMTHSWNRKIIQLERIQRVYASGY